jgi:hypothetical protein
MQQHFPGNSGPKTQPLPPKTFAKKRKKHEFPVRPNSCNEKVCTARQFFAFESFVSLFKAVAFRNSPD